MSLSREFERLAEDEILTYANNQQQHKNEIVYALTNFSFPHSLLDLMLERRDEVVEKKCQLELNGIWSKQLKSDLKYV